MPASASAASSAEPGALSSPRSEAAGDARLVSSLSDACVSLESGGGVLGSSVIASKGSALRAAGAALVSGRRVPAYELRLE